MKSFRMTVAAVFVLLLPAAAIAAGPYLVSDPTPEADHVTHFVVKVDAQPAQSVTPTPERALKFDLSGLDDGAHTITVKAANVRAESVAVPFALPAIPKSLTGLRLSTE